MIRRITSMLIIVSLVFQQTGFAQVSGQIVPGYLSRILPADRFRPVHIRSMELDETARQFELLLEKGGQAQSADAADGTIGLLMEYFYTGLVLSNDKFWVNLRPDGKDKIMDPYLEKTEVGKVFLEADVQLKRDIARFTSPDTKEGKVYWNKLYAKAESLFAGRDIEIPTATRPWIVPGEIMIGQTARGAYIYKASLKVMLEQDYINDQKVSSYPGQAIPAMFDRSDPKIQAMNAYSTELINDLIIPRLTREVNSSIKYARLRQVYYSLIFAQWYKERIGKRLGADTFGKAIDSNDLAGLESEERWSKDVYYGQYLKSIREGEYNKQEQVESDEGITIRSYYSGGVALDGGLTATVIARTKDFLSTGLRQVSVSLPERAGDPADSGKAKAQVSEDDFRARIKAVNDRYRKAVGFDPLITIDNPTAGSVAALERAAASLENEMKLRALLNRMRDPKTIPPGNKERSGIRRLALTGLGAGLLLSSAGVGGVLADVPLMDSFSGADGFDPLEPLGDIFSSILPSDSNLVYKYSGPVNTGNIGASVNELTSLPTRYAGSPENTATAGYIRDVLETYGYEEYPAVSGAYYIHEELNGIPLYVAGVVPGSDSAAGAVVVSAHFDGVYYAADDNASGVGSLLELARLMGSQHPQKTIYVVFTNAEEFGFIGAEKFTKYLVDNDIAVDSVIDVDTIGQSYRMRGDLNQSQIWVASVDGAPTADLFVNGTPRGFVLYEDPDVLDSDLVNRDASVYSKYFNNKVVSVSGLSYGFVKGTSSRAPGKEDTSLMHSVNDSRIDVDVTASVTQWLGEIVANRTGMDYGRVGDSPAVSIDFLGIEENDKDRSGDLIAAMKDRNVTFNKSEAFTVTEEGSAMFVEWWDYMRERFPSAIEHVRNVNYGFGDSYTTSPASAMDDHINIQMSLAEVPVYWNRLQDPKYGIPYFDPRVVWTHEVLHEFIMDNVKWKESRPEGLVDPYGSGLVSTEIFLTDLALYILTGDVMPSGAYGESTFDMVDGDLVSVYDQIDLSESYNERLAYVKARLQMVGIDESVQPMEFVDYTPLLEAPVAADLRKDGGVSRAQRSAGLMNEILNNAAGRSLGELQAVDPAILDTIWRQYRAFMMDHIQANRMPVLRDFDPYPFMHRFNLRFEENRKDWYAKENSLTGVPILILYDAVRKVAYSVPVNTMADRQEDVFLYDLPDLQEVIGRLSEEERAGLQLRVGWGTNGGLRGFFMIENDRLLDFKGYTINKIKSDEIYRTDDPLMTLSQAAGEWEAGILNGLGILDAKFSFIGCEEVNGKVFSLGQLRREGPLESFTGSMARLSVAEDVELSDLGIEGKTRQDQFFDSGRNLGRNFKKAHENLLFHVEKDAQGYYVSFSHAGQFCFKGTALDQLLLTFAQLKGEEFDRTNNEHYLDLAQLISVDLGRFFSGAAPSPDGNWEDWGFIGHVRDVSLKENFVKGFVEGYLAGNNFEIRPEDLTIPNETGKGVAFLKSFMRIPRYKDESWLRGQFEYDLNRRLAYAFVYNMATDPAFDADNGKDGGDTERRVSMSGNPEEKSRKAPNEMGGIDLRNLRPGHIYSIGSEMPKGQVDLPALRRLAQASDMNDLDAAWARVCETIRKGDMPYGTVKEFAAVCLARKDASRLEILARCLYDILKMEEESASPSSPELKEVLAIVESSGSISAG